MSEQHAMWMLYYFLGLLGVCLFWLAARRAKALAPAALQALRASMKHPINRVGFLVFVVGLLITVVCLAASADFSTYSHRLRFPDLDTYLFDRPREWWQSWIRYGLVMVVVGAITTWFFQSTVGRIVRWIRTG